MPTTERAAGAPIATGAAQGAAVCAVFAIAFYAAFDRPHAAVGLAPPLPAPPPSAAPTPVQPKAAAAAPAAAPSIDGIVLYGVSGGGVRGRAAILGDASGAQRVVPVGRAYRPGLTVAAIGLDHVVLRHAGGDVRLTLSGRRDAIPAGAASAARPSAGGPAAAVAATDPAALRAGFAPRRSNGRIEGFAVRSEAKLPFLAQAGLRPGDVLVSVNGQTFDSNEKLLELPREIAGSYDAEFEFIRNGRRMKATLAVNPKPGA